MFKIQLYTYFVSTHKTCIVVGSYAKEINALLLDNMSWSDLEKKYLPV